MFRAIPNLNGNSVESLVEQSRKILDAIRNLESALIEASPHGRNYQTAESGAWESDRADWNKIQIDLMNLHNRIMDSAIRIQNH